MAIWVKYVLITLIGYLFGSISPSYFIAKFKGFNIKERGSKNCGASNAFLTMGIKIAVVVGFIDIFKVFIAVLIAYACFRDVEYFNIICAFSCIIGHMYPFYLRFRGGKGFACLIACMVAINFWFGLITIAIGLIFAGLTNYIVVATIISVISTSIYVPIATNISLIPMIYAYIPLAIIFIKHIPNIIKIIKGEEFHIYKKKDKDNQS